MPQAFMNAKHSSILSAISENLFLVSGPGGGSDPKGRISDGGVVFLFDRDTGDIIKEFRNADPNPDPPVE